MFDVSIREFPERVAVTLPHRGSYQQIGRAFEQVGVWFATRGLLPEARNMIGLYFDDPTSVPEAELRSLAGIVVDQAPPVEEPFAITPVRGGEYAVLRHKGPYVDLPAAYQWLYGTWLPGCGREVADAPPFEEYLNTPRDVPPTELLTDICVPLK